jgi:hypothetical protein
MPAWAKDKLGLGGAIAFDAPALTPAPAAAASSQGAGRSLSVDNKTEINVYASSADAQAVGTAVARRQDDVNARLVRNTMGAVQ